MNGSPYQDGNEEDRESHRRALTVYLNDHLAGATAGVRLAGRLRDRQEDPEARRELGQVVEEVAQDRSRLVRFMREWEVPVKRHMIVLGQVGEVLGRLKPNGNLLRPTRTRVVLELEALLLGVQGKAALWRALGTLPDPWAEERRGELRELLERADRQAETLEKLRQRMVGDVIGGVPVSRG